MTARARRTWDDIWDGIKAVHDENPWLFAALVVMAVVIL